MPMKFRPMTEDEEKAGDYPDLTEGTYYAGRVKSVDYARNKDGLIVGLAPAKVRDGKSAHPWGQIKLVIRIKLDDFEKDFTDWVPVPLNEEKCKPWNGLHDDEGLPQFDGDGKALGTANTFTEDELTPFIKPLRSGGQMKNKMAQIAEAFGWKPFVVYPMDTMVNADGDVIVLADGKPAPVGKDLPPGASVVKKGTPIRQWLDFSALLNGRRCMVGKIREKDGNGKPKPFTITDIIPSDDQEPQQAAKSMKDPHVWVVELLDALKGKTMNNGKPYDLDNVVEVVAGKPGLENVGVNMPPEKPSEWEAIGEILASSCINRGVTPLSKFVEPAAAVDAPKGI